MQPGGTFKKFLKVSSNFFSAAGLTPGLKPGFVMTSCSLLSRMPVVIVGRRQMQAPGLEAGRPRPAGSVHAVQLSRETHTRSKFAGGQLLLYIGRRWQ